MEIDTTLEQNTVEWRYDRRGKITGSNASSLVLEQYTPPRGLDTLHEKLKDAQLHSNIAVTDKAKAEWRAKIKELEGKIEDKERQASRLKTNDDFWRFVGEAESDPDEHPSENPRDRGHRLEHDNIIATVRALGLDPSTCCETSDHPHDPGVWRKPGTLEQVSPDAYEETDEPTWAIECKSPEDGHYMNDVLPILFHRILFDPDNDCDAIDEEAAHDAAQQAATDLLAAQLDARQARRNLENAKGKDFKRLSEQYDKAREREDVCRFVSRKTRLDYGRSQVRRIAVEYMPPIVLDANARDFDFIPSKAYRGQVLQYFNVNPSLETLYFSFYHPQVFNTQASHVILTITRESVADELGMMREGLDRTLGFLDIYEALFPADE
jgi:hypothetical protein